MGIQPEIKEEKEKERERDTGGARFPRNQAERLVRETGLRSWSEKLAPSFIVQKAFYTFDKTWRSMGNTKLCSVSSPDSYQNQAFLSAYLIIYTSLR